MNTHLEARSALAVIIVSAAILPASAQAPPTDLGASLVWSSQDKNLYTLNEMAEVRVHNFAGVVPEYRPAQDELLCEPQLTISQDRVASDHW